MKKNRKSKFILGFLVGGIVGAGIYFAATKKKGFKIPTSIIESGDGMREHGVELVDEIRQYVSPSIESAKVNAIPVYDRVVDNIVPIVEDALDRSVSLIEDLRNRVSPTAEEIRSKVDAFSSHETLDESVDQRDPLDDLDLVPQKSDTHLMN